MSDYQSIPLSLNRFFKKVRLKKQYIKKMHLKVHLLNEFKASNYKKIGSKLFKPLPVFTGNFFVMYIINISFSKKNTLIHISDCLGNIKFFYSAGSFQQQGKSKTVRNMVLRKFYKLLLSKFKFLHRVPVIIHFKNTDSNMFWFLKKLKKKLFIVATKHFNLYSYNGCRKKKIRRKKFRKRSFNI